MIQLTSLLAMYQMHSVWFSSLYLQFLLSLIMKLCFY